MSRDKSHGRHVLEQRADAHSLRAWKRGTERVEADRPDIRVRGYIRNLCFIKDGLLLHDGAAKTMRFSSIL